MAVPADGETSSASGSRASRSSSKQSAQDKIHLHGQGSTGIEVCGVIVGRPCRDDQGPYLLVEHVIAGNGAASRSTNVTFTAETWQHIHDTMDRDHPDEKILGWYHTHPGFGIFLSDMDVFICDNFFNLPWQVAFVYDPISGEEGNFIWRGGRPQPDPVLVEDDVTPQAAAVPLIDRQEIPASDLAQSALELRDEKILELLIRVRRLERRMRVCAFGLIFVLAFVCMWAYLFLPAQLNQPIKPVATPSTPTAATPVAPVVKLPAKPPVLPKH